MDPQQASKSNQALRGSVFTKANKVYPNKDLCSLQLNSVKVGRLA